MQHDIQLCMTMSILKLETCSLNQIIKLVCQKTSGARKVVNKSFVRSPERQFFDGKVKVGAYLLTRMTIVVMSAARKTKPPNELRAMIDVRLSLAPYVADEFSASSLSTGVGMFTSGI